MMDWLSGLVGENTAHIISFIALFAVFLALVFVIYAIIKRMTAGTYVNKPRTAAPRLTVTDAAAVDSQRRLVLVRRDDVEHLILIGGPTDIVIEQNISRRKVSSSDDTALHSNYADPLVHDQRPSAVTMPAHNAPIRPSAPAAEITDIIAAAPVYQPESERQPARQRAEQAPAIQPAVQSALKPAAVAAASQAPTQTQAQATAQPLQTHAQQVAAAARQQQVVKPASRMNDTATAKLHPVYPLGQVSRGVVAATSGLAAANNAAQQEMIAAAKRENRGPSLDDVRPGTNQNSGEGNSLVLQRATPQINRDIQQKEPSFTNTPTRVAPAAQKTEFDLDLEKAVANALSSDDEISFESLLASEMDQHFSKSDKPENHNGGTDTLQSGSLNISARE